jgi:hypothetical protein
MRGPSGAAGPAIVLLAPASRGLPGYELVKTLYALLAGIDAYRFPVPALRGCRNDIQAVHTFLAANHATPARLAVRTLRDGEATRAAVIDGFRSHLGQAGPGDVALFWFSGHGSYLKAPRELWHLEPGGELQTLVCADSRHDGVPDLLDKELSLLISEVAGAGAHVVVVLDSCHSGGASRIPDGLVRTVPPAVSPPVLDALLPRLPERASTGPRPDHIALAACRGFELAQEMPLEGQPRGVFSWALLRAMGRLGTAATYRQLLTAARCEVEDRTGTQAPQLFPVVGTLADQPFLGGDIAPPATAMVLRYVHGWQIDAGSCHGIPSTVDGVTRFSWYGSQPSREALVTRVLATHSEVEPVDWIPDRERQYPVVLSELPLPRATVTVGEGWDEQAAARIRAALARGGPSLYLRPAESGADPERPELRVVFPGPGRIRILDSDGGPLCADLVDADGTGTDRAVRTLEQIARWRRVRALTNPISSLAGAVSVELVPARPDEVRAPLDRAALSPGSDGVIRLRYRRTGAGWQPPGVFIRLRNHTDRRLYCVLLGLTDRFGCGAELFPGAHVGPGVVAHAFEGGPAWFILPDERGILPGALVRDWLKLLVAEEEFASTMFEQPGLGEPGLPLARTALRYGNLNRLGCAVAYRDMAAAAGQPALDWTTTTVPVVTCVPDDQHTDQ